MDLVLLGQRECVSCPWQQASIPPSLLVTLPPCWFPLYNLTVCFVYFFLLPGACFCSVPGHYFSHWPHELALAFSDALLGVNLLVAVFWSPLIELQTLPQSPTELQIIKSNYNQFLKVHVYINVLVCIHVCTHKCGVQRSTLGVIPWLPSIMFFGPVSFTVQQTPGTHLSPLPQCWDYQCVPHPTFIRDGTQVFLLVLVWQAFHCLSYLLSSKPIKELIDFVRALMIIVS